MHSVLLIPELLGSIFDCLVEDTEMHPDAPYHSFLISRDTRREGLEALAALARTCRAFSEPALNALWYRLRGLWPLLRCSHGRVSYGDAIKDETLFLFDEDQWKIVLRYTPRVRELMVTDEFSLKILQSLWSHASPLFPNLRRLYWSNGDDDDDVGDRDIASIRLLLGPSLVDLNLCLDDGDGFPILAFLKNYPTLCPNLKSLHFEYLRRVTSSVVQTATSQAFCRFPSLEVLTSLGHDLSEEAFVRLTRLRCLKQLHASLPHLHLDNLLRLAGHTSPDRPHFENLRILDLDVKNLSSVIPYLKHFDQQFEDLCFQTSEISPPKVLHEFFVALDSTTRRRTLRNIQLSHIPAPGRSDASQVDFEVLSPLLAFDLRSVDLSLRNFVALDDNELVRLVQGWPNLETFRLNELTKWELSHIPTLRGLLLVLARCPKLHKLGLCVDARARTIPSLTEDEVLTRNVHIKRLGLANSPIKQSAIPGVAQFLLEHFPSLSRLSPGTIAPMYRCRWEEVIKEMKDMRGSDWYDGETE